MIRSATPPYPCRLSALILIAGICLAFVPTSGHAQGSIFGAVQNSDLSIPPNGAISFFGFLDDTDEEIRIESSTGAGYDQGNWFDDFQNYLTEAAGNPYDYYFYDASLGEGFHLERTIPSNSFQQEDVTLSPVSWPSAPTGLGAKTNSTPSVQLSWDHTPGRTIHIYRRAATSSGSFFRIDNPEGLLSDPGESDSVFADFDVDGVSAYQYVLIAEDGSGQYSPHSEIITADFSITSCCVGIAGDLNGDGADADPVDLAWMVDDLFSGGPDPVCPEEGDLNGDGAVADPVDLAWLVENLFNGGPPPVTCP